MLGSINQIMILGLPLTIVFGILTFLSLATTASLGFLVFKGRYNIPFKWHMGMAAVTIVIAAIHVFLVIIRYF